MVIDKEIINRKLAVLENFIRQIENMDFDEQFLLKNEDVQHLIAFRLQQAIETAIEIATYMIVNLGLERQDTARDAFVILARGKIIADDLAEKLGSACGFRNLVVHGYQKIDFRKLFYNYKNDLNDLRGFARQIHNFLEKN